MHRVGGNHQKVAETHLPHPKAKNLGKGRKSVKSATIEEGGDPDRVAAFSKENTP